MKVLLDGKPLPDTEDVSFVNFLGQSLFSVFELYIQDTLVSSKNYYNICSYILAQLSYSEDYKKDILKSALYIKDVNAQVMGDANKGYSARKTFLKSNELELISDLMEDFCLNQKWLLSNVNVRIRLKLASTEFVLWSANISKNYSIEITQAVLYCKKILPNPQILDIHEKYLQNGKCATYPYALMQIKALTIAKSSTTTVLEIIFSNARLPSLIVVAFTASDAFVGKLDKNPYYFTDFKLSKIICMVDNLCYEYRQLNLNVYSKVYLLAYQSLIKGLNLENKSVGIDRDGFTDGNFFLVFSIHSTTSDAHPKLEQTGKLIIELGFSEALTQQVTCIIVSKTQAVLSINKHREISLHNQGAF